MVEEMLGAGSDTCLLVSQLVSQLVGRSVDQLMN